MSLLPGYENMQSHEVIGIDGQGRLLVDFGDEARRYKLFVSPTGSLKAAPHIEEQVNGVDQLGDRQNISLAKRIASYDQG